MSKRLDEVGRDWQALALEDPLWAVLMKPGTRHGGWDPRLFMLTGQMEVDLALAHLNKLVPNSSRRTALDFGAGAGRTVQALARHFEKVVGVDVSAAMLAKARELDQSQGRSEFILNARDDLTLFEDNTFDLVYSSLVLQHIPPAEARKFLTEMGRVVRPGGSLIVQVASEPLRNFKGLVFKYAPNRLLRFGQKRVLGYPAPMRMHAISAESMRSCLARAHVDILDRVEDTTYGGHWRYHRYFAVKRF